MTSYSVGGVRLPRPFKIRRFGHFGYNMTHLTEGIEFYVDDLGFRVTDQTSLFDELSGPALEFAQKTVDDPRMVFTTNGSDHHALLLASKSFGTFNRNDKIAKDNTLSQITWQVGTLREVIEATDYLTEKGVRIIRVGRDMPGGNWHVYFLDPDGNTIELYYGMEQVGWNRLSKPREMYYRGFYERFDLPQMSEWAEVQEALGKGIDIASGSQPEESHLTETYDVGGVLLPRPFKVTRLGPVSMFADELDAMVEFHSEVLGLTVTERVSIGSGEVVYLRAGAEHHSFVLASKSLRAEYGLSEHTSNLAVGMEVGDYAQLRAAGDFLAAKGHRFVEVPPELHLGIDYALHLQDPDGHLVQLYYYMEQVGWDGKPRPADQRRVVTTPWPDEVDALSDTFADQTFMGPLG